MNNYNQTVERTGISAFFAKIYAYMGMGVGISALTSYLTLTVFEDTIYQFVANVPGGLLILWAIEIGLVLMLSAKAVKNPTLALGGFIAYAAINGVVLSFTLRMYTQESITNAFISAAVTYGVMAVLGYRTKKDLSGMAHAMRSALIGVIIVILLNAFLLHSSPVSMFISIVTIFIFAGLTAYDHQKIKAYYYQYGDSQEINGIAIFCALQLYLDFINLLISFLRIFGSRD